MQEEGKPVAGVLNTPAMQFMRTARRIPESTLYADLKVHQAPGAPTNVVRKGREFEGNHGKSNPPKLGFRKVRFART